MFHCFFKFEDFRHAKHYLFCFSGGSGDPWTGSDRDYTYDELLKRVFTIIQVLKKRGSRKSIDSFDPRGDQLAPFLV